MLLPEQKKTLEELITYLQDKPVGSVEFIAFSDRIDWNSADNKVDMCQTNVEVQIRKELENLKRDERMKETQIGKPHDPKIDQNDIWQAIYLERERSGLRQAEVALMLTERDIARSKSTMPGYFEAYTKIESFIDRLGRAQIDYEGSDRLDVSSYDEIIDDHFEPIRDAIYLGTFPIYQPKDEHEDNDD